MNFYIQIPNIYVFGIVIWIWAVKNQHQFSYTILPIIEVKKYKNRILEKLLWLDRIQLFDNIKHRKSLTIQFMNHFFTLLGEQRNEIRLHANTKWVNAFFKVAYVLWLIENKDSNYLENFTPRGWGTEEWQYKVHIFWDGHKILRNLHLTFVLCGASQK